ncbi:MAG TPA: hypothetical protein VD970_12775 [Acetobacteraceae bacterium]|nr:hypothetical protein [Acetobacteraceae bacterium]
MRGWFVCAAILAGLGGAAHAQTSVGDVAPAAPSVSPDAGAGVVPNGDEVNEDRARLRIEGAGYSDVSRLSRDGEGVWRGQAMRGGRRMNVGVDRSGNVIAEPSIPD